MKNNDFIKGFIPMSMRLVLRYLCVMMMLAPCGAAAQSVVTPNVDPGRIEQRFRVIDRPDVEKNDVISAPSDVGDAAPVQGDLGFVLKEIRFENLTAFSEDALKSAIYGQYIGTSISLATLNQIVAKITAHYRNEGYILSRAILPPQRIENGIVTIRIVEGFVSSVRFEGLALKDDLLNRYAQKIRDAKPLSAGTLERYLLLIEDLPGITARAVIQPSPDTPGASEVVVTLSEKKFDALLSQDNRGSRFIGSYQTGATLGLNNLLGGYNRTQLRGIVTAFEPRELKYGQFQHEMNIGGEGTKAVFALSATVTNPGSTIENLDIHGEDHFYSVAVTHPFIRSRQSNLFGSLIIDARDVDVEVANIPFYEDRVRAARLSGAYDFIDDWSAVNRMELIVSKGIGVDDDTSLNTRSRASGEPTFLKGNLDVSRLQPIDGPLSLFLAASGQLSADPLLSSEQFGVGGASFGSAYDPSEITGDSGIAGRAELQYNRSGDFEWVPAYQIYGFYDYGKAWKRGNLVSENRSDSLASTGLGTRFNLVGDLSGSLEVATPLTKKVSANRLDGDATRVFFTLSYDY